MMDKYPCDPGRIRYSWADQRRVGDDHLRRCSRSAQGVYLFLAVISGSKGLSYYLDRTIRHHLSMKQDGLLLVRYNIIEIALLLYVHPLYQLLSFDLHKSDFREHTNFMHSVGDFKRIPRRFSHD